MSIFFFRNALGRSDWEHVSYSSSIPVLLLIVIILKHKLCYLVDTLHVYGNRIHRVLLYVIVAAMIVIGAIRIKDGELLRQNFPLTVPDNIFIPNNTKDTIKFLRSHLRRRDHFFAMTNVLSWYYFLDKPCPTRYAIVWFASPRFMQEEIIADLKEKYVKLILVKSAHWANYIDGIHNIRRLPLLYDYIQNAYQKYVTIDGHEIWMKK
jgi:hypothetical protein